MLPPCSTDQFTIPLDFCLDWLRTKALGVSWLETRHFLGFLNLLLEDSQKCLLAVQGSLRAGTKEDKHKEGRARRPGVLS